MDSGYRFFLECMAFNRIHYNQSVSEMFYQPQEKT